MSHPSTWTPSNLPTASQKVEATPVPHPLHAPVVVIASAEPIVPAGTLLPSPPECRRGWLWPLATFLLGCGAMLASHLVFRASLPVATAATVCVTRAPLEVCLLEEGCLESADVVEVRNPLSVPQVRVAALLPFGSQVKAGEVVARLDAAAVQSAITAQEARLATAKSRLHDAQEGLETLRGKADGDLASAQLQVDLAQADLDRYQSDEKQVELAERRSAVAQAERELHDAEEKLSHYRTFHKRGFITADQFKAKEAELNRLRFNLSQSQARLAIFEKHQVPRQERQLRARVDEAKRELARVRKANCSLLQKQEQEIAAAKASIASEEKLLATLTAQLGQLDLKAPRDGVVSAPVTADPAKARPATGTMLEPGQVVFSLPNLTKLRVKVRLAEADVVQLKPGQPARVQLDPASSSFVFGEVERIDFLAEQTLVKAAASAKDFIASIALLNPPAGPKLGQKTRIEIPVGQKDDALLVPVPAVAELEGRHFAWVVGQEGLEQREVRLGATDGRHLEVRDGLAEGESVVLNPRTGRGESKEDWRQPILGRWSGR